MTAPRDGRWFIMGEAVPTRRVFTRAGVGGHEHSTWVDVPAGPDLDGWLDAGLVTLQDYGGGSAPDVLPPRRCC